MKTSTLSIFESITKAVLGLYTANFVILFVINFFYPSLRLFVISGLFLFIYFLVYKFVKFKSDSKVLIFYYYVINIPLSIFYLLFFSVFFIKKNLIILSVIFIIIYIYFISYSKKRVIKKLNIEVDKDGVKFAKWILKGGKKPPKLLILAIGIWGGTNSIELSFKIFLIIIILIYTLLVVITYYTFFEAKYCIENGAKYIYKGPELEEYSFK